MCHSQMVTTHFLCFLTVILLFLCVFDEAYCFPVLPKPPRLSLFNEVTSSNWILG